MDFLFVTPNGIAAFAGYTKGEAMERAANCARAYHTQTGGHLPMDYLGPCHPRETYIYLCANPRTRGAYVELRGAILERGYPGAKA